MFRTLALRVGTWILTCSAVSLVGVARGQVAESDWTPSLVGSQSWQVDANWSTGVFPNDPGRVDGDMTVFDDVIGANLSVALGSDLDLDVGATDVTIASLRLGGTAGPVTTTVLSSGGRLVFENNELNDNTDPDNIIPSFNSSRSLIISQGVSGSTNVISAPIHINGSHLDLGSTDDFTTTRDLIVTGPVTFEGEGPNSLNNIRNGGPELVINGSVVVSDINVAEENNPPDAGLNYAANAGGTIRVNGVISGDGRLEIGRVGGGEGPTGTVILSGANTISGGISYGRGTILIDNDQAFGTAQVRQGNQTGSFGAVLASTDDSRVINNVMSISQYAVFGGEHSLEWAGDMGQTNARGIVNLLPAGKTLTLSGTISATREDEPDEAPIPVGDMELVFDGSGKTVVTGTLIDTTAEVSVQRSFGAAGTGAVYIQGSVQSTPNLNTYSGFTLVDGGNLHFATIADMGFSTEIRSQGGAIGLDDGTFTGPGSATLLGRLNNRSNPTNPPATVQSDFVTQDSFDTGALMLAASESAVNLDFTSGALANASDMSLAGPEQGITYTGTVTPANSTYRFGGGAGVITLSSANQLTGANGLVATNGHDVGDEKGLGGVRITATNDYTGPTRIEGKYLSSNTRPASGEGGSSAYNGTTLTVTSLADGGQDSSIGASSNAASNLVIQGSTLRYEGGGDTTDRLFTIGTHGATLDSSGSGALVFSNTGSLTIGSATDRSGTVSGLAFAFETATTPPSTEVAYNLPNTDDLVIGMQISDSNGFLTESATDDDETITIVGIQSASRVQFSDPIGPFVNFFEDPSTLTFVDVERTFTLTGDNTGDNTLAPIIGDSPTNVVNLSKEGAGKWILTAENTYTGDTSIEDGVLSITNDYLADAADVLIDQGAVFDLDFAGTDTIGALFLNDAGMPVGTYGALGTGADFELSYFSGTGILNVTERELTEIPGDYNNNGVVDAADYVVYRNNLGAADGTLVNDPIGGVVGSAQLEQWRDHFGATEAPAVEAALSAAVPEPTALVLVSLGLLGLTAGRRR